MNFFEDESGQTAVEYLLLIGAAIGFVALVAWIIKTKVLAKA